MSISLGLCYNADIRNNGTACRAWDALKRGLGYSDLIRYTRPASIPEGKHDLVISIDDGRDDIDFDPPRPNAFWAIDTHLGYEARLLRSRRYDWVFCAQKEGVERMRSDGIKSVHWLPLACHPPADPNLAEMKNHSQLEDHKGDLPLDVLFDLVFVGFLQQGHGEGSNNRIDYLDAAFKAVKSPWLAYNKFFEDAAIRYLRGRLGFNISIRRDLNMRFFEILSYGVCQVTNNTVDGIDDLGFEEGVHYLGYKDKEEMEEKIQWGLSHPVEREKIAEAGHKLARQSHTYAHRMKKLLDICGV